MIPKIIHYCWFGGGPKPKSVDRCIASWKKYCPDFEIREWTEKDFDITQNEYTWQAYKAKAWGFVPDYIRLWIIYNYGGIYLDTDVQIIKDLTPLLQHSAYMGFESNTFVNLGHGFGAEAGNSIVRKNMELYNSLHFVNEDGSLNKTASPHYTTQVLRSFGLTQNTGEIQCLDGTCIYPVDFFCPKDFGTGITTITSNTYSIHHFDASWFDEEAQSGKIARWKQTKRRDILDRILHIPHRLGRRLFGDTSYEKLKKCFKRG